MLALAVKARLPLIACTTRDTLNLPAIVKFLTGKDPQVLKDAGQTSLDPKSIYIEVCNGPIKKYNLTRLFEAMGQMESSILFVNPDTITEHLFDAGEVPVPRQYLVDMLTHITKSEKRAVELTRALGGCTVKEAVDICMLSTARSGALTPQAIVETRKASFQGSRGLTHVDTAQSFYSPTKDLLAWIKKEKGYFLDPEGETRLRPRGLLLDGPPGTGKTAGAKFIASEWGVPLYRLDMGGVKNKYVGNSEANLTSNLSRVDHEEPCVLLVDEVEKVFNNSTADSSGITTSMMQQFLWWLAEHKSRVLTVMTTNNEKSIPPELHRDGRIDQTMCFIGLTQKEAAPFVAAIVKTFELPQPSAETVFKAAMFEQFHGGANPIPSMTMRVNQAALTQSVIRAIKDTAKKSLAA